MFNLLRADEMDVAVETARGENLAFARDDIGAGADHDRHTGLNVRITSLADSRNVAVLDGDIGLYNPQ